MNRIHGRLLRTSESILVTTLIMIGACLLGLPLFAQAQAPAVQLTAGPVYTTSDETSSNGASSDRNAEPKFPDIDVIYELRGELRAQDSSPILAHPGDLKLFAQGQEIATANGIRPFERTGYGVTAILAIDASGSMRGAPLSAIHASIAKFVNQARPQDQVAVLTFADQAHIDVPFRTSHAALAQALKTVEARGKFTRLYDGVLNALALFTSGQPRRRQLLVISDGHDEGSQHTLAEVIIRARSLGAVIDSIGLTKDSGDYFPILQQLSLATGGTFVRAQSDSQLETLIGRGIAATLAAPVAAFSLNGVAADGKLLSMQLRWLPGKLTANAFLQTPKSALSSNLLSNFWLSNFRAFNSWLSSFWLWFLAGCFLAGVILLALSMRRPRVHPGLPHAGLPPTDLPPSPAGQPSVPAPYIPPAHAPAHTPAPMPYAAPIDMQEATGEHRRPALRTPTLAEGMPAAASPPTPSTSKFKPRYNRTPVETEIERRSARIPAFFEVSAAGVYARLQVKNGSLAGQRFPVTAASFSVGALADNQLVLLGDSTISAHHLHLHWESAVLFVEDTNSTNGTYLNRLRLPAGRHPLRPGDEIGIGQVFLVVERA